MTSTTGTLSVNPLIANSNEANGTMNGYLYKKTRDGRWQKRWFETNGNFLKIIIQNSFYFLFLFFFFHKKCCSIENC